MKNKTMDFCVLLACMFVLGTSDLSSAFTFDKGKATLEKLSDFNHCHDQSFPPEACYEALERWVEAHPDDAFKSGQMTRLKMIAWNAVPFFAKAFATGKGNCNDEDVHLAVLSALDRSSGNDAVSQDSRKIGLDLCFKEMKDKIAKQATMGSHTFKNTCKKLSEAGLLTGLKKQKCVN